MIRRFAPLAIFAGLLGSEQMTMPRFAAGNELMRPEGYREWMFAGANYGMGYTEAKPEAAAKPKTFHNIFVQREAAKSYQKSGQWPDGTMLVMEVVEPGTNASINKQGMFQNRLIGIEVAVKDSKRFAEKWAYFQLFDDKGALPQAKAFAKDRCWSCHNEHAAADNVFVQFYPAIRDLRK